MRRGAEAQKRSSEKDDSCVFVSVSTCKTSISQQVIPKELKGLFIGLRVSNIFRLIEKRFLWIHGKVRNIRRLLGLKKRFFHQEVNPADMPIRRARVLDP